MVKARKSKESLGPLEEFYLKKLEAEERLAASKVFAVIFDTPNARYLFVGGNETPVLFSNKNNFGCAGIGASLAEIMQSENLFTEINSSISAAFSPADLHSTVVTQFLSSYLKMDIEDITSPIALAIEFLVLDSIKSTVTEIRFDGSVEINELEDGKEKLFIVGAYGFREEFEKDIKKLPRELDGSKMTEFAESMKKKYKLKYFTFVL